MSGFTNFFLVSRPGRQIYENPSSNLQVTGHSRGELSEIVQYLGRYTFTLAILSTACVRASWCLLLSHLVQFGRRFGARFGV
jgi:hypothetical protein